MVTLLGVKIHIYSPVISPLAIWYLKFPVKKRGNRKRKRKIKLKKKGERTQSCYTGM